MGKNCIREVLKVAPERLVEVFVAKGVSNKDSLLLHLQEKKIPCRFVSKQELSKRVQSESHQSFIASVKERGSRKFKDFCEAMFNRDKASVLMLDSIYDPQNMGALFRAAECFGVDAVVWSKNRGADITPTVSKISVGATELVEHFKVSNLAEAVKELKKADFQIVSLDVKNKSLALPDFEFSPKTAFILGSEGEGVQKLLSTKSDVMLKIPLYGKIDSLNVSQAACVILSHFKSKI